MPQHINAVVDINVSLLQGKYGEALGMYNKALEIKEKQYGKVHPSVARCLNNIAQLYMNMVRCRHRKYSYSSSIINFRQREE